MIPTRYVLIRYASILREYNIQAGDEVATRIVTRNTLVESNSLGRAFLVTDHELVMKAEHSSPPEPAEAKELH